MLWFLLTEFGAQPSAGANGVELWREYLAYGRRGSAGPFGDDVHRHPVRLLCQAIFVVALLVGALAEIGVLRLAWRSGLLWFVICFFIPGGALIYFLFHRRETWRLVAALVGAAVIAGLAWHFGDLDA